MPRGDRTGPLGMGPRSGRAMGYCANNDAPGFMNESRGRGPGAGMRRNRVDDRGRCFGWRDTFRTFSLPGWMRLGRFGARPPAGDAESEKRMLQSRVDTLESQISRIRQRLNDLGSSAENK